MNKTLELTKITNVADVQLNTQYVANYNGLLYFGQFTVTTYDGGLNFVWNGSVFPQGIPFNCLDAVFAIK